MQPEGDLQAIWIMFNHVKHVKGWTTITCHVYDFFHYKVMTIAKCDMQFEDTETQCIMQWNLNKVMANTNVPNPNFKRFMAHSTYASQNAVRIIYDSGDPNKSMVDKKLTYFFHWSQSMDIHTKEQIKPELQNKHRKLCYEYKNAIFLEEVDARYVAIHYQWYSLCAANETRL